MPVACARSSGRCGWRTVYSSGVTIPWTTASPRPQLALITISSVAVVSGFAVNMTPDTSDTTIVWITTAINAADWSNP